MEIADTELERFRLQHKEVPVSLRSIVDWELISKHRNVQTEILGFHSPVSSSKPLPD